MANLRKRGLTALKVLLSVVLLYFVFTKIQFQDVLTVLKQAHPWYLLGALLFFTLSKLVAAFRLNAYFHQIKAPLTQMSNLKLYLQGMFYNLFLPGGIGGDAYKGYVIKKEFDVPTKRVVAVLLLDRLSGLLLLLVFACVIALLMNQELLSSYKVFFLLLIPLGIVVFWFVNKQFFGYVLPVFWKSFAYSILVQLAQLIAVVFIMKALRLEVAVLPYLLIFLVSSIVAVLPLTIGGIGSRELVFFYGALWLGLDENTAVGISMVFFLITAFVSLFGMVFHFKKPQLSIQKSTLNEA